MHLSIKVLILSKLCASKKKNVLSPEYINALTATFNVLWMLNKVILYAHLPVGFILF